MKIRHRALCALALLVAVFLAGTISSSVFLSQSNGSLDVIEKGTRAVLSVIDPINHSRTMRVRLEEAMTYRDSGRVADANSALRAAEQALSMTRQAYGAYEAMPRTGEEVALAATYSQRYQAYLDQGLLPLMRAAENGDASRYHQLVVDSIPNLERDFGVSIGNLLAYREAYARGAESSGAGAL